MILAFWRQKQEDYGFEVNLSYLARPCLKKPRNKTVQRWAAFVCVTVPSLFFSPGLKWTVRETKVTLIMTK